MRKYCDQLIDNPGAHELAEPPIRLAIDLCSIRVARLSKCRFVPIEHPGALVLGTQTGTGSCVDQVGPLGTVVKLSPLSLGALLTIPAPVSRAVLHVHGLMILSITNSSGLTVWIVTSAGVQITSRGPDARMVLETLHKA